MMTGVVEQLVDSSFPVPDSLGEPGHYYIERVMLVSSGRC